ncbi:radical SAM protein [Candidatus Thorarchaeota archaeon]|nr:MAG: radical SAM protein [Candidatus Thorarchaeota archaeon]
MPIQEKYPLVNHPCFANNRKDLYARIHLPVAKRCNVKCVFCDHNSSNSCHTAKPGYAARLMTPTEAIARTQKELKRNSNLRIIAISGPGEPLFNKETFEVLEAAHGLREDLKVCLSTNGVLLGELAARLEQLDVNSVSVSMSAIDPIVATRVYEWAIIEDKIIQGVEMGKQVISRQLKGIEIATRLGIPVKINTVLMPGINTDEIATLSTRVAKAGAILQNIVPLVTWANTSSLVAPTSEELAVARQIGGDHIPQFIHCKQCRSDVVGIPGEDRIL